MSELDQKFEEFQLAIQLELGSENLLREAIKRAVQAKMKRLQAEMQMHMARGLHHLHPVIRKLQKQQTFLIWNYENPSNFVNRPLDTSWWRRTFGI